MDRLVGPVNSNIVGTVVLHGPPLHLPRGIEVLLEHHTTRIATIEYECTVYIYKNLATYTVYKYTYLVIYTVYKYTYLAIGEHFHLF